MQKQAKQAKKIVVKKKKRPSMPVATRSRVARGYAGRQDPTSPEVQAAWQVRTVVPRVRTTATGATINKTEVFTQVTADEHGGYWGWWSINPANNVLFPWCSRMAGLYEQFKVTALSVEYTPICNYVATGELCMAIIYDATDEPVLEITNLSQYEGAVIGAVRTPMTVRLNPTKLVQFKNYQVLENGLYTVSRTSTPALFAIRVSGCPAGQPCGRLSVSYTFEFTGTHYPEGMVANHTASCDVLNINTVQGEALPLGFELSIPNYSIPGWIQCTSNETGEYVVRDSVDRIQLVLYGRSDNGHPNAVANWIPDIDPQGLNSCFSITSPPGQPALNFTDFAMGLTDLLQARHACFCVATFGRPVGTMGDWSFRFAFYLGRQDAAYAATHWAHFVMRIMEFGYND